MAGAWQNCSKCGVLFQSASGSALCVRCNGTGSAFATVAEPGWFYAVNRQKRGPVARSELARLAVAGQLKPTDMVLREGTTTWMKASDVEGVFSAAQAATVSMQPPLADTQSVVDAGVVRAAPPRAATPNIPGYEILEILGRGGMGVVYKARQTHLKRLVALKMILAGAQAGTEELLRFRTEAQAVARLKHPNVVQIYEVGEHEGKPYCALEFVEGGTLAKHLSGAPLPPRQAAEVLEALARAMDAAHQAGIVHRDLKPANVLLATGATTADGSVSVKPLATKSNCAVPTSAKPQAAGVGTPKVADFGLAKRLDDDSGQTQTGAVMGTPSYMAPEQAKGETAGPLVDVYALGAIFYECLTGRPPFRAATMLETLDQVRTREPVSPRSLQPSVPQDVETICLKCLEKDPAKRYPSAGALADDLQRCREDRPIVARPANVWERSLKFTRRNKLLVGSAASVFFALLIGLIASSIFLGQARASAKEAEDNLAEAQRKKKEADDNLKALKKESLTVIIQSAKFARQRGQVTQAIELFDKALTVLKENNVDPGEVLLEKAKALAALNKTKEAAAILDDLRKRPNLGPLAGEVLLVRADVALGEETDQAIRWIKDAIKLGLPEGDKEYGLALLADSAPAAIEHCRRALVKDPHHHSALGVLSLSLLVLGRTNEARDVALRATTIYPEDPNFRIVLAIVHALHGDLAAVRAEMKAVESQLGKKTIEGLSASLEVLHDITTWDTEDDAGIGVKLMSAFIKLGPHMQHLFAEGANLKTDKLSALNVDEFIQAVLRKAKAPPLVARNMLKVQVAVTKMVANEVNDATLADMAALLKVHPEGTLRYIHGMMHVSVGKYREGELILVQAAKDPAVAPIRRKALTAALACEVMMLSPQWTNFPDPEVMRRGANNVRALYAPGGISAREAPLMARIAAKNKQFDLAKAILTDWEALAPKDPVLHRIRADILFQSGDLTGAVMSATRLPNDAEIQEMKKIALDLLDEFVKKQKVK
jgi:serine/threonine protein kinase